MGPTARGVGETFAKRVREVRERRGWTQQQLADRLRELGVPIDRTKVNRVETGARAVSIDDALAIAAALGVSPSVLFFPLASSEPVRLTPERVVAAEEGRRWFRGEQPLHPADEDQPSELADTLAFLTEIAEDEARDLRSLQRVVASLPELLVQGLHLAGGTPGEDQRPKRRHQKRKLSAEEGGKR
jgi:transcriptional regulator with XRE-family HTH domain